MNDRLKDSEKDKDSREPLLDDESFSKLAADEFSAQGRPGVDQVTRQRVWNRIDAALAAETSRAEKTRSRISRWFPAALILPVAAAIVLFVFRNDLFPSPDSQALPGQGVKGVGDFLPVTVEVMMVRKIESPGTVPIDDAKRFMTLGPDEAVSRDSNLALMLRGKEGFHALVTRHEESGPHHLITDDFVLPGMDGALLSDDSGIVYLKVADITPATPGDTHVSICAVAASSRGPLIAALPQIMATPPELPPMMECQKVHVTP